MEVKVLIDFSDDVKQFLSGLASGAGVKVEAQCEDGKPCECGQKDEAAAPEAAPVKKTRKPRAKKAACMEEETSEPVAEAEPEPVVEAYTPAQTSSIAHASFNKLDKDPEATVSPFALTTKIREIILGKEDAQDETKNAAIDMLDDAQRVEFVHFCRDEAGCADIVEAIMAGKEIDNA